MPRLRGDAGATTEFVLVTPAFLFTIMLIVQAGLYFHAVSVASAAAQDGARAASVAGGTIPGGETRASDLIADLAPKLLDDVHVQGRELHDRQVVRMTVDADVTSMFSVPGGSINLSVHESSERTREHFRPANEA
ncbi:MAG TPA: TadE family protein, partial [Acidimicrobiales bacterium]|nr:TadE family protein [Acidimicrobiales bacterium]